MSQHNSAGQRTTGLLLAAIVIIVFLLLVFFNKNINPDLLPIVRFLAAMAAAYSAFIFIGEIEIAGKIPGINIKATAAFAIFVSVFFLFNYAQPQTSPTEVIQKQSKISQKVLSNIPPLEVQIKIEGIDGIANNDRMNYKIFLFARPKDNYQKWDFQGDAFLKDIQNMTIEIDNKLSNKCFLAKSMIFPAVQQFYKYPKRYEENELHSALKTSNELTLGSCRK